MDNLVLEALVAELRPRLVGWPVFRAGFPGPDSVILLFDDPSRSRLLISAAAALPRLHLTGRRAPGREEAATQFAQAVTHHLGGAILETIEKDPRERVVRLRFAGASGPGKSLVAELLGRSSNILLLDPEDRVLSFLRRLKSEFRAPVAGERYDPPRPGTRRDPRELDEATVAALAARSAAESHPLSDLLLEACPSLGSLAAREAEHRALRGERPWSVLREWLDRAFAGTAPFEGGGTAVPNGPAVVPGARGASGTGAGGIGGRVPGRAGGCIYSEAPPGQLDPRRAPGPGRYLLSPLPLAGAEPDLEVHRYATLNEAADIYYESLEAGMALRARRGAFLEVARREAKRAREISLKVRADLAGMEEAGKYRIFGEALLAGLTRAERRGQSVIVPDPYDPDEKPLAVPIDPALSLQANAERHFVRFRRAERGRAVAALRLAAQTERARAMEEIADGLADAGTEEELARAQQSLSRHGIAIGLERTRRRAEAPAAPRESGVRVYHGSEGYEILVGKGAQENDRLTFKVALPEDWWLHAQGATGAHVVVRCRKGETRLPAATLREAAELAAFFSRAKEAGRVEVMVTRRKYVRRVRGGPRGTVTVKKHETVSVAPRNPFE